MKLAKQIYVTRNDSEDWIVHGEDIKDVASHAEDGDAVGVYRLVQVGRLRLYPRLEIRGQPRKEG